MEKGNSYKTDSESGIIDFAEDPVMAYSVRSGYSISPVILAAETGIDWAKDLSVDYKKEIKEGREEKYL